MTRSPPPFLATMLLVVLAALFVVMTTAFMVIPQVTGGHPGEVRTTASTPYHAT